MKRHSIGDPSFQKLLGRFNEAHSRVAMSKQHIDKKEERDEVTTSESKLSWPEICSKFNLGVMDKDSFERLEKYQVMGWVRTEHHNAGSMTVAQNIAGNNAWFLHLLRP